MTTEELIGTEVASVFGARVQALQASPVAGQWRVLAYQPQNDITPFVVWTWTRRGGLVGGKYRETFLAAAIEFGKGL